jgi:medium-chain acyl-[acyl-carrier-protein] hydrolase
MDRAAFCTVYTPWRGALARAARPSAGPRCTGMNSPWLSRFAPRPAAALRLFCFSYAGGGAAIFRPFALAMPADVEVAAVVLPGRENRLRERPLDSMGVLLQALLPALVPEFDRPFAFFGHSMGGLVAFEVARTLAARGLPGPARLIVSARRAPHLTESDAPLHPLPDDAFIAELDRRYGGIPAEILQHRDLLDLLLPAMRGDMTAIETYRHQAGAPLQCPITVFGGTGDTRARHEVLAPWQQHSLGPVQVQQFPGGHFYFNDAAVRSQLIAELARLMAPLTAAPAHAAAAPPATPAARGLVP